MDAEPATVNTSGNVGITSGLGARMIAVIVICFLVCVFFAGLRIVLRVILIVVGDGIRNMDRNSGLPAVCTCRWQNQKSDGGHV